MWAVVLGVWVIVAVFVICGAQVVAICRDSDRCSAMAGACCCVIPCLWPCALIIYMEGRKRCDLCGTNTRNVESHGTECLEKNQTEYDAFPNSHLYKCKNCWKPLKLWPVEKLSETQCYKCEEKYSNYGRNVHVCFECQISTSKKFHLCKKHHRGEEVIEVNFLEKASIYEASELIAKRTENTPADGSDIPLLNPAEPSAPSARAGAAGSNYQIHPDTIVELASEDISYAGRRFERKESTDLPPPPTYEEAATATDPQDNVAGGWQVPPSANE